MRDHRSANHDAETFNRTSGRMSCHASDRLARMICTACHSRRASVARYLANASNPCHEHTASMFGQKLRPSSSKGDAGLDRVGVRIELTAVRLGADAAASAAIVSDALRHGRPCTAAAARFIAVLAQIADACAIARSLHQRYRTQAKALCGVKTRQLFMLAIVKRQKPLSDRRYSRNSSPSSSPFQGILAGDLLGLAPLSRPVRLEKQVIRL